MKTSLETLAGLNKSLTVSLPIDTFQQKTDKVLRKMAANITIDGFRKGKVPMALLRQRFAQNADAEAVNEIVNETLTEALTEVKVTPAGRPSISNIDKSETDFSYTVEFEIYPDIQVGDFSKLSIEQAEVEITQADEEKTLQGLIEQATEYQPVERKSEPGDQLTIDFKGTIDGKDFAGGSAKDFKMVLGKGAMIAGFESGLIGMLADQSTVLDLQFPENYQATHLAGQQVKFEVTVTKVAAAQVPKLDDEFANKFGEKDIDALKVSIKKRMQVEAEDRLARQNKEAIFDALLAAHEFDVPQASIDTEAQNLLQEMQVRMQQQGIKDSGGQLSASAFNKEAARRVKLGLLIAQIASDNKFVATKAQIDEKLAEMSQAYGEHAQQMVDYYNADPSRLSTIELLVVEKMVQELILSQANISIKSKKFEAVTANNITAEK